MNIRHVAAGLFRADRRTDMKLMVDKGEGCEKGN
jgi:hypothetical protein